jgi:hypothetical protein
MEISHGGENARHFRVKPPVVTDFCQSFAKQAQSLQRIDRMHRPLQRQMNVEAFEEDNGLIDEQKAVGWGQ